MKPYEIRRIGERQIEVISYPFNGKVNVRMVPGDPTTLKEVFAHQVQPGIFTKHTKRLHVHFAHAKPVDPRQRFPLDMLRYNSCSPCDAEIDLKSNKLQEVLIYQVSVALAPIWSHVRWGSYGWEMIPVTTIHLENL